MNGEEKKGFTSYMRSSTTIVSNYSADAVLNIRRLEKVR